MNLNNKIDEKNLQQEGSGINKLKNNNPLQKDALVESIP